MRSFPLRFVAAAAMLAANLSCGGSSPTVPPPPVPTTTVAPQPSPSPSPAPSPSPTAGTQTCQLEPGPVVRMAVSPRTQRTDGAERTINVRVRTEYQDEVWCLDKDKAHVLDFNANQRNANGRECCYTGKVQWTEGDPDNMVLARSVRDQDGFVYRLNVDPRGRTTSLEVSAQLDGVTSFPWQSGSFYPRGPLRIVTMPASQITRECTCVYRGNGVYEGNTCPKPKV